MVKIIGRKMLAFYHFHDKAIGMFNSKSFLYLNYRI